MGEALAGSSSADGMRPPAKKAKAAPKKALMSEEEKAARERVQGMRKLNGELVAEIAKTRGLLEKAKKREESWIEGLMNKVTTSLEALETEGANILAMQGKPVTAEVWESWTVKIKGIMKSHRDGHAKALQKVL